MHFLAYSDMKLLASHPFLNSFAKIGYKNTSIYFFNDSHIYDRVIIAFLAKLDLNDSTSLSTSGMMTERF